MKISNDCIECSGTGLISCPNCYGNKPNLTPENQLIVNEIAYQFLKLYLSGDNWRITYITWTYFDLHESKFEEVFKELQKELENEEVS